MQNRFAQYGKTVGSCLVLQAALLLAIGLAFGINPLSPTAQHRLNQVFDRPIGLP
jgi:hypothetical protein